MVVNGSQIKVLILTVKIKKVGEKKSTFVFMDYIWYILLFFDDAGSSNAFEYLFSDICHRCSL